ncbi:MAG TPA: outer membrane protein assembly factor BamE [Rhodospirillaceae bacterium]|nr:cell envelope protein SmpA [Rhodospirillaceae bacterium]HAA91306.1 outer membrane protein assembly factor BamE [Rhodospirillaceae bacterium]HAT35769.1 outer membrane protein assembly factor BamE [Rhodospirillaceae bacterium]|tara:strand:- start:414 stop:869 length:456 start_codon:yes stop_codon:yes gene_type:complete
MMQSIKKRSILVGLALIAALVLGACSSKTALRGNLPTESQLAKIKVGETSRQEVAKLLGNPSTRGTFDSQVWYYISRQTSQWAFMPADIVDQQVVAIYFTPRGKVQHLERYRTEDGRKVDLVERETKTSGHELGFWEQMFGNLGLGIPTGN